MEECVASIIVVALGTAIATDYISFPPHIIGHPVVTILMVLFGVGAFIKYPVLGIAIFLTAAIVIFKRNTQTARAYATYGIQSIRRQPRADAEPSQTQSSEPRQYDQFQETDASNPMHATMAEGFEPAPYGNEELNENVEGAFPIGAARVSASADSSEYVYRPDANTGSNAFERFGPDMDEKKAFAY
jgi:uncharacterized membrane protein YraQ (UPF0718 family)